MGWSRLAFALLIGLVHAGFAGAARADVYDDPGTDAARPQEQSPTAFELGFRTGYGIPIGKATDSASDEMNELIAGQIPLWVDIGLRFNGHVALGAYFSYGFGILASDMSEACDELEATAAAAGGDASCSTSDMRLGLQIGYHFAPSADLDPWIAGGIGYEIYSFSLSESVGGGSATTSIDARGFEYVNLQTGLDFRVAEHFRAGPFLGLTFASYDTLGASCSGDCGLATDRSEDIDEQSIHSWLFFGLRGVVMF